MTKFHKFYGQVEVIGTQIIDGDEITSVKLTNGEIVELELFPVLSDKPFAATNKKPVRRTLSEIAVTPLTVNDCIYRINNASRRDSVFARLDEVSAKLEANEIAKSIAQQFVGGKKLSEKQSFILAKILA